MNWGTVPEWFAAVGTVAAFVWAVFLHRSSVLDSQKETARRIFASVPEPAIQLETGSRVELAKDLATVYDASPGLARLNDDYLELVDASWEFRITVHNDSNEPVTDLALSLHDRNGHLFTDFKHLLDVIGPGTSVQCHSQMVPVGAGGTWRDVRSKGSARATPSEGDWFGTRCRSRTASPTGDSSSVEPSVDS